MNQLVRSIDTDAGVHQLFGGNERDARDLGRPVETRRSVVRTPALAVSPQS
jgi:hypothetical protein